MGVHAPNTDLAWEPGVEGLGLLIGMGASIWGLG